MSVEHSFLTIRQWHDHLPKGRSRWALSHSDQVTHGLTLPRDAALHEAWSRFVPEQNGSLEIVGRYGWRCIVEMPSGIKRRRRIEFVEAIERREETRID